MSPVYLSAKALWRKPQASRHDAITSWYYSLRLIPCCLDVDVLDVLDVLTATNLISCPSVRCLDFGVTGMRSIEPAAVAHPPNGDSVRVSVHTLPY